MRNIISTTTENNLKFTTKLTLQYQQVTTKSKLQWKLLLESKPPLTERQWSRDTEDDDMGFEKLDVRNLKNSILHPLGKQPLTLPGLYVHGVQNTPPFTAPFWAECDKVGTALWSHARVVVVNLPPQWLTPPSELTPLPQHYIVA